MVTQIHLLRKEREKGKRERERKGGREGGRRKETENTSWKVITSGRLAV